MLSRLPVHVLGPLPRLETFLAPVTPGADIITVRHQQLRTYAQPFFYLGEDDAIIFRTAVNGSTTASVPYPRTELREARKRGDWSAAGRHALRARAAVTEVPKDNFSRYTTVTVAQLVSTEKCPCLCHKVKLSYLHDHRTGLGKLEARTKTPDCREVSDALGKYQLGEPFAYSVSMERGQMSITAGARELTFRGPLWNTSALLHFKLGSFCICNSARCNPSQWCGVRLLSFRTEHDDDADSGGEARRAGKGPRSRVRT